MSAGFAERPKSRYPEPVSTPACGSVETLFPGEGVIPGRSARARFGEVFCEMYLWHRKCRYGKSRTFDPRCSSGVANGAYFGMPFDRRPKWSSSRHRGT